MSDYRDGWDDGKADRDPDFGQLALGWNRLNAYERGYIDSGYFDEPQENSGPGATVVRSG